MHTNTTLTSPHERRTFFFNKGASPSFLALLQRTPPSGTTRSSFGYKKLPPGGQTIDIRMDPLPFELRGGNPTNK